MITGDYFLRCVSGVFGVKLSSPGGPIRTLRRPEQAVVSNNLLNYLQTICTAGKEDHTECRKCPTERIVTGTGGAQGGLDETSGKALGVWNHTLPLNRAGAIGVSANTAFNRAAIDANPATGATAAQPPEG